MIKNQLNSILFKRSPYNQLIYRLSSSQRNQYDIFDRQTKLKQRDYTLKLPNNNVYDYLKNEFGFRLFDSLLDVKR